MQLSWSVCVCGEIINYRKLELHAKLIDKKTKAKQIIKQFVIIICKQIINDYPFQGKV